MCLSKKQREYKAKQRQQMEAEFAERELEKMADIDKCVGRIVGVIEAFYCDRASIPERKKAALDAYEEMQYKKSQLI